MLKNNLPPAPNPNTKGGGTPKPATEKPFLSPSTTRNMQLMLRCLHVKTGQKGDLHQHLAVRYKSRKSCCYLPPRSLHLPELSSLPVFYNVSVTCAKKNHRPQPAIKQVTMQATCTGTPQVVNIFPTVPVGVYSAWCHAVNNETSPQLRE